MNYILVIILGIIPFVLGIMLQNENFIKKYIKWSNSLRGSKAEITKSSKTYARVTGMLLILIGLVFGLLLTFGSILPMVFP